MGTTVRTSRFQTFAEEHAELRAAIEAADADALDNWGDPEWMRQFHEDMVETIWMGFEHHNFVNMLATVEIADDAERITIEEVYGLDVHWVSAGGQIDESQLEEDVWELKRHYVGYHVSEFEEKIRNGFSKFQGKLVPAAINQMDSAVNSRLLRTYQAAVTNGDPEYISNPGLDLDDVNTAITEVTDIASSRPDFDGTITIIGRGTMVDQIMNQLQSNDNFAPQTQDDIVRTGRMGIYRGANILKLRNWRDRNKVSFFPANELLVVANNAAKVGFWGGMKSKEWTEEGGEYWHNWGRRQAGFAVHHPEFTRRIVDTDQAA